MYTNVLIVYFTFINVIYYVYGVTTPDGKPSSKSKEYCYARVSTCEISDSHQPVCGTDGRTYPTKCRLLRAQCTGEAVNMVHKGPCAEGQSSCLTTLRYALNEKEGGRTAFTPRCRSDGTYAAVQCHTARAGGCWCVSPDGKPVPNTTVRNGKPDCNRTGKSHAKRRSSARGQRNKKSCSRTDRGLFNGNLLKIFSGEYERGRTGAKTLEHPAVAEWKFTELDRDRSGALEKPEYRGLRRLIKKVVKPKRCARAWARGCDADGDGAIARAEWAACLLATAEPPAPDYDDGAPQPEPDYEEEPALVPSSVLPGLMRPSFPTGGEQESRREDEADCLSDRQAVLDEQKSGLSSLSTLYVPECTGDGRYARAQCYRTTPYCWCVHQDTGKPIPGSAVKDRSPDCDAAPHYTSPMKGCPEPMKTNFLRDLINLFIVKMTTSTNGSAPGSSDMVKWGASKEEQAATWTFVMLDKDKNKALDRREWKAFHQLISTADQLRRCGRKLPRYCDVNHDSKISITEWLACLDVSQVVHGKTVETTKTPSNPRRKGPNPLESILKADD